MFRRSPARPCQETGPTERVQGTNEGHYHPTWRAGDTLNMGVVREFLETSTIHGLFYIATTDKLARLFWMFVVLTGFMGAGVIIQKSYASWKVNPVSTSLETHSIANISFPRVTVCPPKNTFTSLNLDMKIMENRTLDNKTKNAITEILPSIIFDSDLEEKFSIFSLTTPVWRGWYRGDTSISFPYDHSPLTIFYKTSALSGSLSSPFFKEPFHLETFQPRLMFKIAIEKARGLMATGVTSIELKLTLDTEVAEHKRWKEEVIFGEGSLTSQHSEKPNIINRPTNFTRKFLVKNHVDYFFIEFRRDMSAEDVYRWDNKRNTGISFSWSYDDKRLTEDLKFRSENRLFIQLANLLHTGGVTHHALQEKVKRSRNVFLKSLTQDEVANNECQGDNMPNRGKTRAMEALSKELPQIYNEELNFENEISDETLAEALKLFYMLTRCPNFYETALELKTFFSNLINNSFPLKTVMVTLMRMFITTTEKERLNELLVTGNLFTRVDKMVGLNMSSQDDMPLASFIHGESPSVSKMTDRVSRAP